MLYLIPAVLLISILGWLLEDFFLTSGYAPSAYPGYSPPVKSLTQVVLIKNADQSGQALLFKVNEDPSFFRYDPTSRVIDEVDPSSWEASTEKEIDCYERSGYDEYSGSSYGHYILGANMSPDKTKIAVLSAYGPKYESPRFGPLYGGDETIRGSRYLEIRSLPSNERLQKPAKIDIANWVDHPQICWSEGEHYVVVYNQNVRVTGNFSVVDVPSN